MIFVDDVSDLIFQNGHTWRNRTAVSMAVAVMYKNTHISTWLVELFMYPVRVRGKIPGTSTRVHVPPPST
jgi:hypothetical protein